MINCRRFVGKTWKFGCEKLKIYYKNVSLISEIFLQTQGNLRFSRIFSIFQNQKCPHFLYKLLKKQNFISKSDFCGSNNV